jgi:carbon-monoxide dehydrogenase large subunit
MKFGIGQPVRRKEDVRLVTGQGLFTDDIRLPGEACALFIRSPYAHARILGIDTSAAEAAPGVIGVLTAKDLDGVATMPVTQNVKNRDGSPLHATPKKLLAADKVRFCGEAVLMLVAETPAQAKDAADLVSIDYDVLPAVTNVEAAATGPQLWDEVPGTLYFDWIDGDETACAAAFAAAAKIVSVDVTQNRVMASPMEPRGGIAAYDAATGRFVLFTGTQGAASTRGRLASLLNIPAGSLRVITPDVGGGFGQKIQLVPEVPLLLIAAKRFGRPVKWTGERVEAFLADMHGRDCVMSGELALDQNACILAIRVNSLANLGGYLSFASPNVVTSAGLRILGGVYRVPTAFVNVKGYVTNTASVAAYRGAGRPESIHITERLMDRAAAAFGLDPIEIRRRNLLRPDELPYRNWKGVTFDSGDFTGNLETAAAAADWNGFPARRRESEARGRKRGRGLGYYVEASGGPPGPEPVAIRFSDDGSARVLVGTQSNGQGHETSFAQLVADRLGLPLDAVTIVQGDTGNGIAGLGTVGSRSLQTAGSALVLATDEIIARGRRAAAALLQAGPEEVRFEKSEAGGEFRVSGSVRTITLMELAAALRREKLPGFDQGLDAEARFDGQPTFPNGCHVCELEVDPETGKVELLRYTIVDDVGRIINPLLVEGQVHGGVAQGAGQALLEQAVYDRESGQMLSASLLDYALPRAEDMPPLTVMTREIPCTTNPLGSKGAGEAGTVGALPAIVSALSDALGVAHVEMPATPERVWAILNEKSVSGAGI